MGDSQYEIERKEEESRALEVGALIFSVVPWIGGPVSAVLSGMGQQRKLDRIKEVLDELAEELRDFKTKAAEEYVKTDDFEEVLEKTLRKAADERSGEVRALYIQFLRRAITEPGDNYDNQMQVLESIEHLRSSHVAVLRATARLPNPNNYGKTLGSVVGTLTERTGLPREELAEVVEDLTGLRLINKPNLHIMMSGAGSEDLHHLLRPLGERVLEYIGPE